MSKQAPPPARVSKETMDLACEMLGLIEALPNGEEKDALLQHKQIGIWKYYRGECMVRLYTHRPTQDEKIAGITIDPSGKAIALSSKARMCPYCKCSAQEFKRHQKTAKCLRNKAKNQVFCEEIQTFNKKTLKPIPFWSAARVRGEHDFGKLFCEEIQKFNKNTLKSIKIIIASPVPEEARADYDETIIATPLPHHSKVRPPPPPPPPVLIKKKKKKIRKRLLIIKD